MKTTRQPLLPIIDADMRQLTDHMRKIGLRLSQFALYSNWPPRTKKGQWWPERKVLDVLFRCVDAGLIKTEYECQTIYYVEEPSI